MHLSGSCCSAKKLELPAEQEEAKQEKQAVTEGGEVLFIWSYGAGQVNKMAYEKL